MGMSFFTRARLRQLKEVLIIETIEDGIQITTLLPLKLSMRIFNKVVLSFFYFHRTNGPPADSGE